MITVILIQPNRTEGFEDMIAFNLMQHFFCEGNERQILFIRLADDRASSLRSFCDTSDNDVLIVIRGVVFITYESVKRLLKIIENKPTFSIITPVSNEARVVLQRHAPPFLYQTPTVFMWAVEDHYRQYGNEVYETEEVDDFCLVLRRDALQSLPESSDLLDLPQLIREKGGKIGVARGVYAHRYGACYDGIREDLIALIHPEARNVLDVGCANGFTGAEIKRRYNCHVTGVEIDVILAENARLYLDMVLSGDIADIVTKGLLGHYDCIICGDVLEHLYDPWTVINGLRNHLNRGGIIIASVPNINNWAIIYDLLKGRWDYVPFSILSGTHIRFFTKQTLLELFQNVGYRVRDIRFQSLGVPQKGRAFIENIKQSLPELSWDELEGSEIVIVAEDNSSISM